MRDWGRRWPPQTWTRSQFFWFIGLSHLYDKFHKNKKIAHFYHFCFCNHNSKKTLKKPHINLITNKISKNVGIMFKVGQFLSKVTIKTLYYSLVYPYIHYCNIIWANNFPTRLSRIVTLQKRAVRTIAKIKYRDSTVDAFKELKILKVGEITELEISLFMFKFYNNQLPKNMTYLFSTNSQIHSYDTRHANDCHLPQKSPKLGQY